MNNLHVSGSVRYIGADDTTIDLFEGQYPVPNGVSYNSYVILDEKVCVMDGSPVWFPWGQYPPQQSDPPGRIYGDRQRTR